MSKSKLYWRTPSSPSPPRLITTITKSPFGNRYIYVTSGPGYLSVGTTPLVTDRWASYTNSELEKLAYAAQRVANFGAEVAGILTVLSIAASGGTAGPPAALVWLTGGTWFVAGMGAGTSQEAQDELRKRNSSPSNAQSPHQGQQSPHQRQLDPVDAPPDRPKTSGGGGSGSGGSEDDGDGGGHTGTVIMEEIGEGQPADSSAGGSDSSAAGSASSDAGSEPQEPADEPAAESESDDGYPIPPEADDGSSWIGPTPFDDIGLIEEPMPTSKYAGLGDPVDYTASVNTSGFPLPTPAIHPRGWGAIDPVGDDGISGGSADPATDDIFGGIGLVGEPTKHSPYSGLADPLEPGALGFVASPGFLLIPRGTSIKPVGWSATSATPSPQANLGIMSGSMGFR
jgi:hypothetical protein